MSGRLPHVESRKWTQSRETVTSWRDGWLRELRRGDKRRKNGNFLTGGKIIHGMIHREAERRHRTASDTYCLWGDWISDDRWWIDVESGCLMAMQRSTRNWIVEKDNSALKPTLTSGTIRFISRGFSDYSSVSKFTACWCFDDTSDTTDWNRFQRSSVVTNSKVETYSYRSRRFQNRRLQIVLRPQSFLEIRCPKVIAPCGKLKRNRPWTRIPFTLRQ